MSTSAQGPAPTKKKNILILGGSGFFSGTLARLAQEQGWEVTILTRGQRPVTQQGIQTLCADRDDPPAFAQALGSCPGSWDLVVDSIAFGEEHLRQDISSFAGRCRRFVFISTDFVYDPARRSIPQPEHGPHFNTSGYGGKKRAAERLLEAIPVEKLPWVILRPAHIYGPGSKLGCLPEHGRDPNLIAHLLARKPLRLVGGGHFIQSPIFAADLARVCLACLDAPASTGQVINVPGPDTVESRTYYAHIANTLGVPLKIEETSVTAHLAAHPESANFLCHRSYTTDALCAAKLPLLQTSLRDGLATHVASIPHK